MAGGDRPAVSRSGSSRQAVEAVWRIESARIVGTLARFTGDFALAEDLAQEALAEALVAWPRDGEPRNRAGWLLTVGRRRAIDSFRRRSALDERYAALSREWDEGDASTRSVRTPPVGAAPDPDLLWDPDRIDDDVLALMFIACHPVVSREAQIALTLRVLGGLTSDEIARAFLVPTATVQARITRAKKTLAAAQVPFEVPPPDECRKRLGSVLSVLYLVFTEGSTATSEVSGSARTWPARRSAWPGSWRGWSRTSRRRTACSRFSSSPLPGFQHACVTTANRSCWKSKTAGVGTRRRSGAGGRRWPRPGGSAAVSARTASRPRSPSVMQSRRPSRRRTGNASCCSTRRSAV